MGVVKAGALFLSMAALLGGRQVAQDASGIWVPKGRMSTPRTGACAAVLADGRVLVTGGAGPAGALDSAELLATNGAVSSVSPMTAARMRHTCVALPDGRVLVAGGANDSGPISLAEIYDPARNRWIAAGDLAYARAGHTATVLADGRVLVGGGEGQGVVHNTLEMFDPAAASFRFVATATLSSPRKDHAAALLPDGRVLFAGGSDGTRALASADLFDPATGEVARAAALASPRANLSATTLLDGRVLVAGGDDGGGGLATAELFDPATNRFADAGRMMAGRSGHLAFLLPHNNQVLLVGGDPEKSSAELFTPWRGGFRVTGRMEEARSELAGAALASEGALLVAGGRSRNEILETSSAYRFATLRTDQEQYDPGAVVTITGSGWAPGEKVSLLFQEMPKTRADRSVTVLTDASGDLAYQYQSDTQHPGRRYYVTATGAASDAQVRFATNPAADLDQCANGAVGTTGTTCTWVNGNLNGSKAHYNEGDSVAYRLVMTNLAPGTNTVAIEWDTTQSGKHALDYLTSYDRTVTGALPCAGVPTCKGAAVTYPIPVDTNVTAAGVTPVSGEFSMWGGAISGLSAYTLSGSYAGSSSTSIIITFNATQPTVVLAWGGHIAKRPDWGDLNSAVAISGSPFHMRLLDLNGSGGNQDRALANDAVVFPATITIVKSATPAIHSAFAFTATNPTGGTVPTTFSLYGDTPNSIDFTNITTFGSYTITETPIPTGWAFDSVSCTVVGSGTASATGAAVAIDLKEGDHITCTYANHQLAGTLYVIKHVINDNGGTKAAKDFTITITGGNPNPASFPGEESPGTKVTVDPGASYSVSEGADSGYTTTYSADCSGTVSAGSTKTCTVTNDDNAATLIVKKHVINDNSGSKTAANFTLNVTGLGVSPASFAGSETGTTVTLNAGTYSVDETAVTGYTKTLGTDCSGTIKNGETKTCVVTNDDQAAKLTVIKHVVNDNGGTKTAADFTITVAGPSPSPAQFPGSETGTTVTLNAGSFSVSETELTGYVKSMSADCSGTIAVGDTKTCTITNDDQPATVIVKKHVINDNGGTTGAASFTMNVTGTAVSQPSFPGSEAGTTVTLNAGTYNVDESAATGYTKTIGADCSGAIAVGETKTCTITNDDQPATLTVIKHVVNDNGGTKQAGAFTLTVTGANVKPSASFAGSEGGTTVTLDAGSYSVDESAATGYTKSLGADCSGTIAVGQNKTCTITNDDKPATLIVKKHVVNNNGGTKTAADFTINVTGASPSPASFAGNENGVSVTLNAGTYGVDEVAAAGYAKSADANCSGTLANGETKTCTITNDDIAPTLTIVKWCVPSTDTATFSVGVSGTGAPSSLLSISCGGTVVVPALYAGSTYTVTEAAHAGYQTPPKFGGACKADGTVSLTTLGQNYNCYILNTNTACIEPPLPTQ